MHIIQYYCMCYHLQGVGGHAGGDLVAQVKVNNTIICMYYLLGLVWVGCDLAAQVKEYNI